MTPYRIAVARGEVEFCRWCDKDCSDRMDCRCECACGEHPNDCNHSEEQSLAMKHFDDNALDIMFPEGK